MHKAPTLILVVVAAVGSGWFLSTKPISSEVASGRIKTSQPGPTPHAPSSATLPPTATHTSSELLAAKKQLDEMKGKVVVVLGNVEDIGKQTATMLRGWKELEDLAEREPALLTVEEKARLLALQRQHAQAIGILPEIAGFQDRPEEYGRFFRAMIQDSLELPDALAAQVETYMRQRAVEMNRLGLNNGKEPTDPQQEATWEQQRDEFNEQTFDGLGKILPAEQLKSAGFGPPLLELLENDFDKLTLP
jgi:hypothetical protein